MEIHLLRPLWLLLIIPIFVVCWLLSKYQEKDNWHKICDAHLLPHLLVVPPLVSKRPIALLALGCLLAVLALAGPSWQQQTQPIYHPLVGRVLVLDLSPAMKAISGTTTKINRARFKLLDYLNRQQEGLTGLVVYSDEAHTVAPLTEDNHTIANFVPILDPNIMVTDGNDTLVGLQAGANLLKQAGLNQGDIVLITDNITQLTASKNLVSSLATQGYRLIIYNIVAEPNTVELMQKLAQTGKGTVISWTPSNADIDRLLAKTKVSALTKLKQTKGKGTFWQDDGYYLVWLLLPLALLAFRRGYL